ncbi:MAG: dihydroorotate dehydrogenase-like protein [Candidatus Aminicenantes bacterium]
MADLSTSYMGLRLKNPLIVASSDLARTAEDIKKCAGAGAGAVVIKSIFEEQFLVDEDKNEGTSIYPEALDYMRQGGLLEYAPEALVKEIETAKKEVDIPLIASINCRTPDLWPEFAGQLQTAGADALELNIYDLPLDLKVPGDEHDDINIRILKAVKEKVDIPVSVKLINQVSSLPYLSRKLAEAGAGGLVFFNWFLQPDIDIDNLTTRSRKGKGDFLESLKWTALLSGRIKCDIASSGGVMSHKEAIKQILAGASAVQICTLLYQKGLQEIQNLINGLTGWMQPHGFESISDFKGEMSFRKQQLTFRDMGEAKSYFRTQYLKTYSKS